MREFDETPKEEERSVGQENVGSAVFQQPVQSSDIPPSDNTASDRSGGEPFADGAAPAGTAASSPDNIAQEPTGSDAFSGEKPETPSAAGTDGWQPAGHVTTAAGPADASQPTGTAYNPAAGQPPYGYGAGGYSPAGGQGYGPYGPGYGGQTPYPPQGGAYGEQGASYTPGSGYTTAQPYQVNQTPPPIQIQKVEPQKSEPTPNKGLRVFCIILAGVLLLSAVAAGGYFVGRSNGTANNQQAAVDLASKPEGTITDEDNQNASYVFQAVKPSVVGIEVYSEQDTQSRARASGVIYTSDGYIVTNDHIYADIPDPKFLILMADGSEYDASYVAGDSRSDLAVLKVEAEGLPAATFGNSDELEVGESVIAIGNPGGQQLAFSATEGVVSAVNRRVANASNYSMEFIQTDTAINPGNSGGALVNMYGQVVGITAWKYAGDSYERIGFAIPTTTMKTVVDSLIANKYVTGRTKLGITYQTIDSVTARLNDVPRGLQIASITEESDLNGKVQVGDIITAINDTEITDGGEVLEVLENSQPGDTVRLTVYGSGGQQAEVTATLLEDRGSSSYTLKSSDSQEGEDYSGNGSEFDFPFGE